MPQVAALLLIAPVAALATAIAARNAAAMVILRAPRRELASLGKPGWSFFLPVGPRATLDAGGRRLVLTLALASHGKPELIVTTDDIPATMRAVRVPIPVPEPAWCKVKGGRLSYRERVAAREVTREWLRARIERIGSVLAATERVRRPDKPKDRIIPV
ncbi:MAG: hypothetical protein U0166_20065 [Acidobacteriota bacterium]